MPLHDWTRVKAGIYHDFHSAWITELRNSLNDGRLPSDYYALGEQRSGEFGPDVLALQIAGEDDDENLPGESTRYIPDPDSGSPPVALAEAPPRVQLSQDAAEDTFYYLEKQRTVVIRHVSDDRVIALIEIVSPGNKRSRALLDDFVDKVVLSLKERIHVLVIDPFPAGRHDPDGIHEVIWDSLMAGTYKAPPETTGTMVSYACRRPIRAFVEPVTVGTSLIDMPLFLTPDTYIPVPIEPTYARAWSGVPQRWRNVIED
jgi:hypothetical protein